MGRHGYQKMRMTRCSIFKPILPEITITGYEILLKGDRIILPTNLQDQAISLSHQGSHPGQNSTESVVT